MCKYPVSFSKKINFSPNGRIFDLSFLSNKRDGNMAEAMYFRLDAGVLTANIFK